MTSRLLKRLAIALFVALLALYKGVRGFANRLRDRGADATPAGEREGSLAKKPSWKRVAIVVVHPDQYTEPFLSNLLKGLAENGFYILVVAKKKPAQAFADAVLPRCHRMLWQSPAKGGFGSCKAGWEWIGKNEGLKGIDTLALVDDSLYYPRHIKATVWQLLEQKSDWLCLFGNFEAAVRTQGLFQIFRDPVLKSDAFADFWRDQASARRDMPENTGLARALRSAGFEPHAYYNAARLRADVITALGNENIPLPLQEVLDLTLGFEKREKTGDAAIGTKDFLSMPPAGVAEAVGVLTERHNPAYSVGLLCNYLYQAPIKRDIADQYAAAPDRLIDLTQGFSPEEKEAIAADWHDDASLGFHQSFRTGT